MLLLPVVAVAAGLFTYFSGPSVAAGVGLLGSVAHLLHDC